MNIEIDVASHFERHLHCPHNPRCAIELSVSPITMAVTAAMAQTVYMQENEAKKPKYCAIMIHLGES